jgi:hypothetical protein
MKISEVEFVYVGGRLREAEAHNRQHQVQPLHVYPLLVRSSEWRP